MFTCAAKSPMTAVKRPMIEIDTQKQIHPPHKPLKKELSSVSSYL